MTLPLIRPFFRAFLPFTLGLASLSAVGCHPQRRPGEIDVSSLPPYEGKPQSMFNDNIEPAAFGVALDRPNFRNDRGFREKVQTADAVAAVKVTTVTIGQVDTKKLYQLQLEVVGEPFSKRGPDADQLEISINESSLSYSIMNLVQVKAKGKTMIAMWKRFRDGDEAVTHWYFAPDDDGTVAAVKEALTLRELK